MAHDEDLADRIRASLSSESGLDERRMFGGLAFLLDGNMAVAASSQGGLMVRIDPADADRLLAGKGVRRMEMRGRPMNGWLLIDNAELHAARQLDRWVGIGVTFARTLPPSTARARR